MHRILERFSAFAATGVVLVYLAGLFLGTATYFVGRAIGVDEAVAATTGVALALAVEVHSFLSQRLTRAFWQQRSKLDVTLPEWDAADQNFRVHLGITCGLVAFSIFNSIAFWALVLHPANFGDWLQVSVRGLVVPIAFLAAGFLTPLQHDASQMLQSAAHTMLRRTVKITIKQWQRRLDSARKSGVDLAPVAVELMEDANEHDAARRIIASALAAAEGKTFAPSADAHGTASAISSGGRPPTGPGTPTAALTRRDSAGDTPSTVIRLRAGHSAQRRGNGGANGWGVRTRQATASVEQKARAIWRPGMTVGQLQRAAGISRSAAGKYRKVLLAESILASADRMNAI